MVAVNNDRLEMVAVHFSTRCGAKCSFCYYGNPLAQREEPTSAEMAAKILRRVAHEGVREVLFVGGDPVVHPHFHDSLKLAKDLGLITSVLSNSWALRPVNEYEAQLQLIDFCEATVLGPTSKLHDALTGSTGSFDNLVRNLKRISAYGKQVGICLNAMPQNLNHMYDIIDRLINEHGVAVRAAMFQRIIPSGDAKRSFKFGLNLDDMESLMSQVDAIVKDFSLPITFEDPVPHCTVAEKYRHYLTKCQWGYTKGSVNHRGELNRCGADDHYRLGTIFDESLQDKWRSHEILVSFRSKKYLPDECQRCDLLEACGGGCPLSCGTQQDHSIDALYLEKKSRELEGSSYVADGVRCAVPDDWTSICKLERILFPNVPILFTEKSLAELTKRFRDGIRVAKHDGVLLGYASLFPLTSEGVEYVVREACLSVCQLPAALIAPTVSGSSGLYVEVIAFAPACPVRHRIGLWRWMLSQLNHYKNPIFTSPVSQKGEQLAKRCGYRVLADASNGKLYLKNPDLVQLRIARARSTRTVSGKAGKHE